MLKLRPVFALAAILTLSIGVGMTTTMFTLTDAVVIRPLSGNNARGMVYLWLESADGDMTTSPTPELLRLVRDHASSFSRVEAYATGEFSLLVDGEPLLKPGGQASTGFFSFLGVRPELGRGFLPGDASGSGSPVVVLSHTFWAERFGESEEALGQTMVIEGQSYEIVGVLRRDFRVDAPREAMFWIPEGAAGDLFAEGARLEGAVAALAKGVSTDAASAELDAIVKNNPLTRRADMEWVGKVRTPKDLIDPSLRKAILLLQAGAFVVLLIACGNLTNLLLAQGETRSRELALRASLGAGRGRLIRQLLSESMVLGGLGIAGGILLAVWALDSLPFFLPPGYAGFSLNGSVLCAAAGLALASILLAGLLPTLRGSRRDLGEVIKAGGGIGSGPLRDLGTRRLLVTAEVAMAFVLLVSAGLFVRNFSTLLRADVGFPRQDLLTLRLELPP